MNQQPHFPLLNLPFVALKNCLDHMPLPEYVSFSLFSKKAFQLCKVTNTYRNFAKKYRFVVRMSDICHVAIYKTKKNPNPPLDLKVRELLALSNDLKGVKLYEEILKLAFHFLNIFENSKINLVLELDEKKTELVNWAKENEKQLESIKYMGRSPVSPSENVFEFLRMFNGVREVVLNVRAAENYVIDKQLQFNILTIGPGRLQTVENIFTLNAWYIKYWEAPKWGNNDIRMLLNSWKKGRFNKYLQFLVVRGVNFDIDKITENIPYSNKKLRHEIQRIGISRTIECGNRGLKITVCQSGFIFCQFDALSLSQ